MALPNEHFKDFPIEYKQLNEADFSYIDLFGNNPDGFEIKKTSLEIEKNEYLNDSLQKVEKTVKLTTQIRSKLTTRFGVN